MHQLHVDVHQHTLPLRWVIELGIKPTVISLYTISNIYSVVSISFVHHTNNINFHVILLHSYIYDILLYIYRIADVSYPYPISYKTLDHYSISHSKQTEDNG